MARVTVEDCVDKIPNRFDLVLLTSQRARALAAGSPVTVDRDNDKNPVVALREVAEETITPEDLHESAIYNLRKNVEVDEPEEDDLTLLMAAQTPTGEAGEVSTGASVEEKSAIDVPSGSETAVQDDASAAPETADATKNENLDGLSSTYFAGEDDVVEEDKPSTPDSGESAAPTSEDDGTA